MLLEQGSKKRFDAQGGCAGSTTPMPLHQLRRLPHAVLSEPIDTRTIQRSLSAAGIRWAAACARLKAGVPVERLALQPGWLVAHAKGLQRGMTRAYYPNQCACRDRGAGARAASPRVARGSDITV